MTFRKGLRHSTRKESLFLKEDRRKRGEENGIGRIKGP
jgi:hypothetical protein